MLNQPDKNKTSTEWYHSYVEIFFLSQVHSVLLATEYKMVVTTVVIVGWGNEKLVKRYNL